MKNDCSYVKTLFLNVHSHERETARNVTQFVTNMSLFEASAVAVFFWGG
jgi:hypothetical protein